MVSRWQGHASLKPWPHDTPNNAVNPESEPALRTAYANPVSSLFSVEKAKEGRRGREEREREGRQTDRQRMIEERGYMSERQGERNIDRRESQTDRQRQTHRQASRQTSRRRLRGRENKR